MPRQNERHNHETTSPRSGEPLVLIPYLAADNPYYAFQVADYAEHLTCIRLIRAAPADRQAAANLSTTCSPTTSPPS